MLFRSQKKLKTSEDQWNHKLSLHAGSMQHSRHNVFKEDDLLMKILAKKCHPLGLPPQQGIDNKRDERDRECFEAHSLVNKNYPQHSDPVSSGHRRKVHAGLHLFSFTLIFTNIRVIVPNSKE
jgi:hypothetical protein